MAKLILDVGESFEHQHSHDTITTLVSGEVALKMGGRVQKLVRGEAMQIPRSLSHQIINTGKSEAVIECGNCGVDGI